MVSIKERKAISLIVLVVTIVVMMIIASVVIFSIGKNNPMQDASKAKIISDIDSFKSELVIYLGKQDASDVDFYADSLDGTTGSDLEEILPSMKNEKIGITTYSDILVIQDGKLMLKEDYESKVDEKIKSFLEEAFAE